jgi:hypothetical protein
MYEYLKRREDDMREETMDYLQSSHQRLRKPQDSKI